VLDLRAIRERPEAVERALGTRDGPAAARIKPLLAADARRRQLARDADELRAEHNRASREAGQQHRGAMPPDVRDALRGRAERIKALDDELRRVEADIEALLLELPNLPHPTVPVGVSEADNPEIRRWGTPRTFAFTPRPHEALGEALGLVDFARAAKLAKARFTVLWGPAAQLERALAQWMVDLHTREHGYTEVWTPHLVNAETMVRTAQLPKFEEQLFKTVEPDEGRMLYLIPTAEVTLTALHAEETLAEASLPRRYVAVTPCYRREAGTYGKDLKGMIRQHQFDKVEMVKVTTPSRSYEELETMVANAEEVLRRLELPYRVIELCTADLGFASAKTYDLEVWLPGQGRYREISSCSNCEAFQARRADIRYRPAGGGRAEYCHTLNGSGLAVGRTLVAVLENYQEPDGSVTIPTVLRPYMGGRERLTPGTS
jgi:seryl-tRNA synthetase